MAATATKTSSKIRRNGKKRPACGALRNGTGKARATRNAAKKRGRKGRAALKSAGAPNGSRRKTRKSPAAGNKFAIGEKAQAFFVEELGRLKKLADQIRSTDGFKKTMATLERRLERLFRFRKKVAGRTR